MGVGGMGVGVGVGGMGVGVGVGGMGVGVGVGGMGVGVAVGGGSGPARGESLIICVGDIALVVII